MSPDQWNLICHRCSWPSTSYFFLNFTSCPLPLTFSPRTQINLVTLSPNQKQIHKTSPDPWVFSSRPWPTASWKKNSPSCTCPHGPLHTGGFCLPGSPVLLGPHLLDVSTRTPCQHPLPFRIAFSPLQLLGHALHHPTSHLLQQLLWGRCSVLFTALKPTSFRTSAKGGPQTHLLHKPWFSRALITQSPWRNSKLLTQFCFVLFCQVLSCALKQLHRRAHTLVLHSWENGATKPEVVNGDSVKPHAFFCYACVVFPTAPMLHVICHVPTRTASHFLQTRGGACAVPGSDGSSPRLVWGREESRAPAPVGRALGPRLSLPRTRALPSVPRTVSGRHRFWAVRR